MKTTRTAPPAFLRLAGDPVRWSLLAALAGRDARVGELCTELGLRQNLVSYHLGRLRSAGLVARRRSTADARDGYYLLDLERCAGLLAAAADALHPGLSHHEPGHRVTLWPRSEPDPIRILFVCTGNSARSRIAEAMADELGAGWVRARSAGSHPKPLHANARRVLTERGITGFSTRSTHLDDVRSDRFDHVVTLCDRVREICPELPGRPAARHWSIPDPGRSGNTDQETYPAFVQTRQEIERRVSFLLDELSADAGRRAA